MSLKGFQDWFYSLSPEAQDRYHQRHDEIEFFLRDLGLSPSDAAKFTSQIERALYEA